VGIGYKMAAFLSFTHNMAAWEFACKMAAFLRVLRTRWRRGSYKMAALVFCLQDGGVSDSFTHDIAAWEICLQNGGVSDGFTHKMAAWEICLQDGGFYKRVLPTRWRRGSNRMAALVFCLQDGGVSESVTHDIAAWEICLQNGGVSEGFIHKMAA